MAAVDSNSSYVYAPLDNCKAQIRLLIVRAGTRDDPICADLKIVSLSDKEEYETISYCWRDAQKRASITVGGIPLNVPASAEAAIRRVRVNVDRTIWIDAVCINQNDLKEREQQVALMGDVFGMTKQNVVWLGQSEPNTAEAVQLIDTMWCDFLQAADSPAKLVEMLMGGFNSDRYSESPLLIEPWLSFVSNPWFERLWCVQEVVLPLRSVVICGEFELPLLKIAGTGMWIGVGDNCRHFKYPDHVEQSHITRYAYGLDIIKSIRKMISLFWLLIDWDETYGHAWIHHDPYDRRHLRGTGLSEETMSIKPDYIAWMFSYSRRFKATNPHDKIFAMLGLLKKNHRAKHTDFTKLLRVDYARSLAHVMRDATKALILESGKLYPEMFSECDSDPADIRIPSWALKLDLTLGDSPSPFPDSEPFPTRQIKYPPSFHSEDLDLMILTGIVVDAVSAVSPKFISDFQIDKLARASHLRTLFNMVSPLHKHPEDDERVLESICRVLIIDDSLGYDQKTKSTMFMSWARSILFSSESCDLEDAILPYIFPIFNRHQERRFFCTKTGCMGLGSRNMAINDIVVVVQGSEAPLILRPKEYIPSKYALWKNFSSSEKSSSTARQKEYALVGHCWVDGIMEGQAVTKHMSQGLEQEAFHIR